VIIRGPFNWLFNIDYLLLGIEILHSCDFTQDRFVQNDKNIDGFSAASVAKISRNTPAREMRGQAGEE